jgi:hypothetical protein
MNARRLAGLVLALGLIPFNPAIATENRVLHLDGDGSFVELPPNIFSGLTEATVEGWVKWESLRNYSRVFEFGARYQSMSLFNHDSTPDLRFNLYPDPAAEGDLSRRHSVWVHGLLRTNAWIHLAAVSGPGGMELYANGRLVGRHPLEASFADIQVSQANYIGRGLVQGPGNEDFRGQLDEFRVWNHRRTADEIRADMFRRLSGGEPGLVGLWSFDETEEGLIRDLTQAGNHGRLIGGARTVAAPLPEAEPLRPVLELDGDESYVELPSNIFAELTEATVEGWVKWNSLGHWSRFFDFGREFATMALTIQETSSRLQFELWSQGENHRFNVAGMMIPGEWCHLAAVSGPGGMKLYFNGVLVGEGPFAGSFASIESQERNYLGRNNWKYVDPTVSDLDGQMFDVRVWSRIRNAEEIRETLFTRLEGTEPGLVGLWRFDDPLEPGRDSSPNAYHGRLVGSAQIVSARVPGPMDLESA